MILFVFFLSLFYLYAKRDRLFCSTIAKYLEKIYKLKDLNTYRVDWFHVTQNLRSSKDLGESFARQWVTEGSMQKNAIYRFQQLIYFVLYHSANEKVFAWKPDS